MTGLAGFREHVGSTPEVAPVARLYSNCDEDTRILEVGSHAQPGRVRQSSMIVVIAVSHRQKCSRRDEIDGGEAGCRPVLIAYGPILPGKAENAIGGPVNQGDHQAAIRHVQGKLLLPLRILALDERGRGRRRCLRARGCVLQHAQAETSDTAKSGKGGALDHAANMPLPSGREMTCVKPDLDLHHGAVREK